MRIYDEVVSELEEKGIFPVGSCFFEFPNSDHPLKEQFEKLFRFGQDFLDRKDLEFNTDKARFFFSDRDASEAYVTYENGYYLIDIYRGTIEKINNYYLSRIDLFSNSRFNSLKSIILKLDLQPKDFFIQHTSIMYFYHEATHFIQQFNEYDKKLPFPDELRQQIKIRISLLREFDADWYGSAQIALNVGERAKNEEEFIELSVMSLSAFFLFWSDRSDSIDTEILSFDRTHPHPLIRLYTWIISLTVTSKSAFGYNLQMRVVLDKAIEVAVLLENTSQVSKSLQMQTIIESRHQEVLDYILQISDNSIHHPYLANNSR